MKMKMMMKTTTTTIQEQHEAVAAIAESSSPSLSPPLHSFSSMSLAHVAASSPQLPPLHRLKSEDRGLFLIQLLLRCASSVSCGHMDHTNLCLEQLSSLASLTGDPMQRVASYFMHALAARITRAWPGLHKALRSAHLPSPADLLAARQVFFHLCPYLKFAFATVNQAFLDAMEGEKVVHLIDLGASEAVQWVALLQLLSTRPGGPPHLRITVVHERKEVLDQTGQRLSEEAERLDIPFQFHPVVAKLETLDVEKLRVKTGEAVGVSSVLQLHTLLAEDDRSGSHRGFGHGTLHARGGSPQADDPSSLSSRERSPYSTVEAASHQMRNMQQSRSEGTASFLLHPHHHPPPPYSDDRGLKRGREEAFTSSYAREAELQGHVYSSPGSTSVGSNGDQTLGELFERERNEISDLIQHRGADSDGCTYTNRRTSTLQVSSSPATMDLSREGAMDRVLRMLRSLSPKIMVVVEQESNHNSSVLVERFVEALHYYGAMFDALESTLAPQQCMERLKLEKHLFGQEIENIIASEGVERVERHEKMERWKKRIGWAGFVPVAFSYSAEIQAKRLLLSYSCQGYRLLHQHVGCLTVCWQDTPLFSASAWQA